MKTFFITLLGALLLCLNANAQTLAIIKKPVHSHTVQDIDTTHVKFIKRNNSTKERIRNS